MLTRRAGEVLLIGDDIEIVITEIKGNYVRVGVKAPKAVVILRKEVRDRDDETALAINGNK
jgi:carbon storage regulator